MWYADYYHDGGGHWGDDDEDEVFDWYEGYKKRKVQNAKIKKEVMPIAWHPSKY